jgi:hypothetical protein
VNPIKNACYFCGEPATSRDHVPPQVFFPELKDLGPQYGDLRKQLLTLRACALHNGAQSKDDEYAAIIVSASITNEDIGADHFCSKYVRTLGQSPRLVEMLKKGMTPTVWNDHETANLRIDQSRYRTVMERIARGLHFHETGNRLTGPVDIDSPCLGPGSPAIVFRETTRSHPGTSTVKWIGDRRVFEYALQVDPFYLHMKFYGGFDVFVTLVNKEAANI